MEPVTSSSSRVKVVIRVRPLIKEELDSRPDARVIVAKVHSDYKRITLSREHLNDREFCFDHVFSHDKSAQDTFYSTVGSPLVGELFTGYNSTIIAYGQTGSGKTYTIFGGKPAVECLDKVIHKEAGVLARSVNEIFERIQKNIEKAQYQITCSFMEIYMETLTDLLSFQKASSQSVHIREDPQKGIYIEGLTERKVKSKEELLGLIKKAAKNRSTNATLMNRISSRSHAILQIMLEERRLETDAGIKKRHHKKALFTVVDLAGSERLAKSKSTETRLEEAKAINKSISALGNCINALVGTAKQHKHIPFRDSKLTRVLTNSLSGNSKTTLIACVSPSLIQYDESLLTLLFACRATGVAVHAVVNEEVLIQQKPKTPELETGSNLKKRNTLLATENETLHKELAELRKAQGVGTFGGTPKSPIGRNKSWRELAQKNNKSALGEAAGGITDRTPGKSSHAEKELQQANMIIKRMVEVVRRLQGKIAEKNLTIRRLKEENNALLKEESKGRSTDISDTPEATGVELIVSQLHNNPQLRSALMSHLKREAAADIGKLSNTKKRRGKHAA